MAIARATSMHPAVLLADEPTGNLDQTTGKEVMNLLEQLVAQKVTLIVVTHDPVIGGARARQIHMVDGQIIRRVRESIGGYMNPSKTFNHAAHGIKTVNRITARPTFAGAKHGVADRLRGAKGCNRTDSVRRRGAVV